MALIHLDAGVVIGLLDGDDAHHHAARASIADALDRGDRLALAASALAESLVGPARRGDEAIAVVHELLARVPVAVVDLTSGIATSAARLRARHRQLRLPDALVIATASTAGADELVTTDARWPSARALGISMVVRTLRAS